MKTRKSTERIFLKYPGFITLKELSWLLRTTKVCIKNWLGFYGQPKLKDFPQPIRRGKWLVWSIYEIEEFLGTEIEKKGNKVEAVEPLLTIRDIMRITGNADSTIRLWIREDGLEKVRVGQKLIRVQKNELARFLDKRYEYGFNKV